MTTVTPRPLRLWPGVAAVGLQWLLRFGVPAIYPDAFVVGLIGSLVCGLLVLLWWAFFSKATVWERVGGIVLIAGAMLLTMPLLDPSLATGAMGMLFPMLALPGICLAFVAWAAWSRRIPSVSLRWVSMIVAIGVASGGWALVRTGGFTADFDNDLHWRWSPTPEEKLLASASASPAVVSVPKVLPPPESETAPAPAPVRPAPVAVAAEPLWAGFRGAERAGILPNVRIETDWAASPPVEVWRKPVGPGWSSFSVSGDGHFYTQEQRGEEELVSCYRLSTGEPVWQHADKARFWESNAGAGPRGTPTLSGNRVYSLGATGILNVLDAATGAVAWSRNTVFDTGAAIPGWGISGSPLVLGDLVIVAVSSHLAAYNRTTGEPVWKRSAPGASYSSPHLFTRPGEPSRVVFVSGAGAAAVSPEKGEVLWEHAWKGNPIVQPAITEEGDVLISANESDGTRRLTVHHDAGGWMAEERWTSRGLKPYFNDFVVHKGHAYGFDGSILACIDLADGSRKWKGGRYGNGQMLLLPSQDLLLILSEQGELALVRAHTDQHTELARIPGIDGKSWNHPVIAGNLLLVRNAEQMAGFRLALAKP